MAGARFVRYCRAGLVPRLLSRPRIYHSVASSMDQFRGKADNGSLDKFRQFYESRRTESAVIQGYEDWAHQYDEDFDAIKHRGHVIIGDVMEELYSPENRGSISILDVAAATGRVGQELWERGFHTVDALDACEPMLEAARKKNVYRKLILSAVGGEPLDIPAGSYDVVTCCAAFIEGHLPADAVTELLRLVKQGGVVVVVGHAAYKELAPDYVGRMASVIEALEYGGSVITVKETREGMMGPHSRASVIVLKKRK